MGATALLTLSVFILTLAPGVCPGPSGIDTARVLRLVPTAIASHPLWLIVARAIARLPLLDAALRLNVFSALCGCAAAALLFRIAKRVLFEFIRDPPAIRLVPIPDDNPLQATHAEDTAESASAIGKAHVIATLGGIVAALAFAFSCPFWIASTALHTHTFNALLLLATLDRLACFYYTGRTSACMVATFLFGLGMIESVAFVSLAPLAFVLILLVSIRYGLISESFLLLMLATGILGVATNTLLLVAQSNPSAPYSAAHLFSLVAGLAREHANDLRLALSHTHWLLVLFQTLAPVLVALVGVHLFSPLQDGPTRWKWLVTNVLFTAFTLACLMNAPHTAWALTRATGQLSVAPALAIAAAAGTLFVYWALVATEYSRDNSAYLAEPSINSRLLGYGLCGLLGLVTLRTLYTNFDESDGKQSGFADRIADAVLAQAGSARCILADGTFDMNLLIRNHRLHQKRVILPATSSTALAAPLQSFVERWLCANPRQTGQIATIANAELWQRTGLIPVPNGLVYTGARHTRDLSPQRLLSTNRAFWKDVTPLLADDAGERPFLSALRSRLRSQLSRSANDLGVLAERLGDAPAAAEAYEQALLLNVDNICANLNRYGLRLRCASLGSSADCATRLCALTSRPGFFDGLDHALAHSGLLSLQEADTLMPALLRDYEPGTRPPENMIRTLEKWLAVARVQPSRDATPVERAPPATPDVRLEAAITLRMKGKDAASERMLRLLVKEKPAHLSAWSLLAEILMNRGDYAEVEHTVLPALRAASDEDETILADMTEGCLRARARPPRLAEARACFLQAFSKNPNLAAASDQLLKTDRQIGDVSLLEADSLVIVGVATNHPTANALLGSLRLSQRRYGEAETFLRTSIVAQPSGGALNDLAELLRQQGKLADAERQARRAIQLAPDLYQAWDTLGNVLLDAGRTEEAAGPLRCALTFGLVGDVRPYLTLIRLRIQEGRMREAGAILEHLAPLPSTTSPTTRLEYASLRKQLDEERP